MNDTAPSSSVQIQVELRSVQDTERYAQYLARCLRTPMIVTLEGDIGTGKTSLVRAILRELGVQGPIKSPTYSLLETYDLASNHPQFSQPTHCHHFDLYRVIEDSELDFIGFRDYFQSNTICFIEWPQRMQCMHNPIDLTLLLIRSGNGRTLCMHASDTLASILRQSVLDFKNNK